MPKVFMIKASSRETSRKRPVALRRNMLPALPSMAEETLVMASALLLVRRPNQMEDPIITPEAFDGKTETVGPIEHPGKFYKLIFYIIGFSLHLQDWRARRNAQERRLVSGTADNFNGVLCSRQDNPVLLFQNAVQRLPVEILRL